jgi:hypothetical protein
METEAESLQATNLMKMRSAHDTTKATETTEVELMTTTNKRPQAVQTTVVRSNDEILW